MWFFLENDNLGSKMKILKFLGIHPTYPRFWIQKWFLSPKFTNHKKILESHRVETSLLFLKLLVIVIKRHFIRQRRFWRKMSVLKRVGKIKFELVSVVGIRVVINVLFENIEILLGTDTLWLVWARILVVGSRGWNSKFWEKHF